MERLQKQQCNAESSEENHPKRYEFSFGNCYIAQHITMEMEIEEMQAQIQALSLELDEMISEGLLGKLTLEQMANIIETLPRDRKTALSLMSLTDSFDADFIYDTLFCKYACFLRKAERNALMEKATQAFSEETITLWRSFL